MSSIIVVEGVHDVSRIKELYKDANIMITDGSKVREELLIRLKELSKTNKIIIFTDPDYSGERIRKIIEEYVPNSFHAFLPKKKCISKNKKKVGIEHAEISDIKEALDKVYEVSSVGTLTSKDMFELKLMGFTDSAILRNKLSDYFNIGLTNGKTFLNRINSFGITKQELEDAICKIEKKN